MGNKRKQGRGRYDEIDGKSKSFEGMGRGIREFWSTTDLPRLEVPPRNHLLLRRWESSSQYYAKYISTERRDIRRILILLVLSNQVLHVRLCFRKLVSRSMLGTDINRNQRDHTNLHLVHSLLGIPMQERLPLEHGSKLVADTLEQLLDGSRVAQERDSHLQTARWYVTLSCEDVVRDPLHKVCRVLVLHILHLFLYLLH
jgi:hypothetical protein